MNFHESSSYPCSSVWMSFSQMESSGNRSFGNCCFQDSEHLNIFCECCFLLNLFSTPRRDHIVSAVIKKKKMADQNSAKVEHLIISHNVKDKDFCNHMQSKFQLFHKMDSSQRKDEDKCIKGNYKCLKAQSSLERQTLSGSESTAYASPIILKSLSASL